ncbi:MAG: hypothetical protein ACI87E_002161, partial [Mariniblastus sp.]
KGLIENKMSYFGTQMMVDRVAMERYFGDLTNRTMGRTCLPSWVRTFPRVQANMIIIKAKTHTNLLTCTA